MRPVRSAPPVELTENRVLASLPREELRSVASSIKRKNLVHDVVVYGPGQRIDDLVFPLTGMISLIREFRDGQAVEVAAVTRDGATGLPYGDGYNFGARTVVQIAGEFAFLDAKCAIETSERSSDVRNVFDRAAQILAATLAISAACNRAHDVEQRLARWLLVADDAIDGEIRLIQEYLATMVGVQRPTLTIAAGKLQDDKVIAYRRGRIQVLDRKELEQRACECHGAVSSLRERILPSPASLTARRSR